MPNGSAQHHLGSVDAESCHHRHGSGQASIEQVELLNLALAAVSRCDVRGGARRLGDADFRYAFHVLRQPAGRQRAAQLSLVEARGCRTNLQSLSSGLHDAACAHNGLPASGRSCVLDKAPESCVVAVSGNELFPRNPRKAGVKDVQTIFTRISQRKRRRARRTCFTPLLVAGERAATRATCNLHLGPLPLLDLLLLAVLLLRHLLTLLRGGRRGSGARSRRIHGKLCCHCYNVNLNQTWMCTFVRVPRRACYALLWKSLCFCY